MWLVVLLNWKLYPEYCSINNSKNKICLVLEWQLLEHVVCLGEKDRGPISHALLRKILSSNWPYTSGSLSNKSESASMWKACKSSLVSHSIQLSSFISLLFPPLISLPPVDLLSWNWSTKYQHYRSFWQFNFNAWLSVNLIIILSDHPINVFYIYNDHQVSSLLLHHLSSVRYWNHKGPWQCVCESSWLR